MGNMFIRQFFIKLYRNIAGIFRVIAGQLLTLCVLILVDLFFSGNYFTKHFQTTALIKKIVSLISCVHRDVMHLRSLESTLKSLE